MQPTSTIEATLCMNAGRRLDAVVAERVMGMTVQYVRVLEGYVMRSASELTETPEDPFTPEYAEVPCEVRDGEVLAYHHLGSTDWHYRLPVIPRYSTDMTAAWKVVEQLQSIAAGVYVKWDAAQQSGEAYGCRVEGVDPQEIRAFAETAPLAICRAAVMAAHAREAA